jgi:hypothetical protein
MVPLGLRHEDVAEVIGLVRRLVQQAEEQRSAWMPEKRTSANTKQSAVQTQSNSSERSMSCHPPHQCSLSLSLSLCVCVLVSLAFAIIQDNETACEWVWYLRRSEWFNFEMCKWQCRILFVPHTLLGVHALPGSPTDSCSLPLIMTCFSASL